MPKKRAQGLSITTVVVAVIALIVIVVVVTILTGKLGFFSTGVEDLSSCENTCNNLVALKFLDISESECKRSFTNHKIIKKVSGISEGNVCCCTWKKT